LYAGEDRWMGKRPSKKKRATKKRTKRIMRAMERLVPVDLRQTAER
jgi:hypothetical protein